MNGIDLIKAEEKTAALPFPISSQPLERLIQLHRLEPTDEECAWDIVRTARRSLSPCDWFKLLFVDLCFDLGFVWPRLHNQESIFRAVVGWVAGDGTAGVIDGKTVQMVASRAPKTVQKALEIRHPKGRWRNGKLTETEFRSFHREGSAPYVQRTGVDASLEDVEWATGEKVAHGARQQGDRVELTETMIRGIWVASMVSDPPNPRDVLVMCRVPRPDGEDWHPDNPGPWGGHTSTQYFFMWGRTPFECTLPIDATAKQSPLPGMVNMMRDSAGSQYSILKWCGYGFKGHKFYSGTVTAQTKVAAAINMLDQLDLAPDKLPPGSKPKRRRANR